MGPPREPDAGPPDPAAPIPSLMRLADGTVKQVSPLTGRVVWTVPGRAARPFAAQGRTPQPLAGSDPEAHCAFCPGRLLETPPERSRLVLAGDGPSGQPAAALEPWAILPGTSLAAARDTVAAFRRIPNLFPILPLEYWRANHAVTIPRREAQRATAYLAAAGGREHVMRVMRAASPAAGPSAEHEPDLQDRAGDLFAGFHDLIVARRHFVAGATRDDQLASAGDLSPLEHHAFMALTIDALRDLHAMSPLVRYVAVYQNWLRPAGASFDHLHKQLAAIDDLGPQVGREVELVRDDPDLFNRAILEPAARGGLIVAATDRAVAVAGVGHRFPTIEVYSTHPACLPWDHPAESVRAISDLVHACHAATGRAVPTNEEWHYRPVGESVGMPWRIEIKWRTSTLAGFEGATRIHVNTLDPHSLRDRMVASLADLRNQGRIAGIRVGPECAGGPGLRVWAGGASP